MRVSILLFKKSRKLERSHSPFFIDVLRNNTEIEANMFKGCLIHSYEIIHNIEIITPEATLKTNLVEPAWAVYENANFNYMFYGRRH